MRPTTPSRASARSRGVRLALGALLALLLLHGCEAAPAATARGDFASDAFWDTPLPGEHRRDATGHIDMHTFPISARVAISEDLRDAVAALDGFGTTTPVYFPLTAPIDPALLPSSDDDGAIDAPVMLVDVDPDSPNRGTFARIEGRFLSDAGPFGAPNLLALLPVQGRPLAPGTLYAAVVTDALRRQDGGLLTTAPYVAELLAGRAPTGMSGDAAAAFQGGLATLLELGLDRDHLVALTVFRTQEPTRGMAHAIERARAGGAAITLEGSFDAPEIYDEYCAYHVVARVPVYQGGEPPYTTEGGAWVLDEGGAPVLQREEISNLWVTVPRMAMPTDGFPAAVLIRTGAGADRPLMDRGHRSVANGDFDEPGAGLGLDFARAGFAGVSMEGPLGGSRGPGTDEQFLIFNINNPPALRDNLRQSALELSLLVDTIGTISIDASACPGLTTVSGSASIDVRDLALVGHSMGASIAPLVAASEPRYRALILSGAGGSWIENILYKRRPIETRNIAESLLGYTSRGIDLTDADPMLALLQWAGEEADAQVYAPYLVRAPGTGLPRHVLMFQGILDNYIPPPVANTLTLSLAIDVATPTRDSGTPELDVFTPIRDLLPLTGRSMVPLPASANVDGTTAVVVQLEEDGVEDGHEVMWQRADARQMVTCFLRTLARGTPSIVDPASPTCD